MGAKLTFKGGIHPYDGKDLSKDKPIKDVLPKGELVYPLSQHIGAPAAAIVKQGDKVTKGQMIAEPAKGLSVGIHASIDGVVSEVTDKYVIIETQEGRAGK